MDSFSGLVSENVSGHVLGVGRPAVTPESQHSTTITVQYHTVKGRYDGSVGHYGSVMD